MAPHISVVQAAVAVIGGVIEDECEEYGVQPECVAQRLAQTAERG